MDARGTIALLHRKLDKDRLFVRVDIVLTENFPFENNIAIPVSLICGADQYPTAQIRARSKLHYPCWISNPPLKRGQEKLGEFLVRHGFKNKDKVGLKVNRRNSAIEVEISKSGNAESANDSVLPDEIPQPERIVEGAKKTVVVNAYERDPAARKKCIEHWGCSCSVCGIDFSARYGDLGKGFIHVHHLKPIAEIGKEYELDPVNDLRPVCPNCHAMIHRTSPVLKIEELQAVLTQNGE
ncbi:MAG: HNH endonuclease [Candidatus Loosdrechtia sp.]|uniref:HNH endonuclease n=1 Tax=Candidatus Loosdrechtia sp. TaxID=3101272 RepID=UPI003A660062|nr:MAG: HNH endonuclease [Candidatus Jettenia sp. AMX2]